MIGNTGGAKSVSTRVSRVGLFFDVESDVDLDFAFDFRFLGDSPSRFVEVFVLSRIVVIRMIKVAVLTVIAVIVIAMFMRMIKVVVMMFTRMESMQRIRETFHVDFKSLEPFHQLA